MEKFRNYRQLKKKETEIFLIHSLKLIRPKIEKLSSKKSEFP